MPRTETQQTMTQPRARGRRTKASTQLQRLFTEMNSVGTRVNKSQVAGWIETLGGIIAQVKEMEDAQQQAARTAKAGPAV